MYRRSIPLDASIVNQNKKNGFTIGTVQEFRNFMECI